MNADQTPSNLTTRRLTLAYDGACVISQLNLALPAGQITVLVGANGCGKSTLLRGLARLLKPHSGTVYLDGKSIFKLSTKEDEPTTFLDLAHQIEVLDLLYDLNQSQGRTIIMVLHDLNQACRYADYLVAIAAGRIVACGKPDEVMTEEMIRQLFMLECRIVKDPVAGTPMCIPVGRKKSSLKQVETQR